MSDIGSGEVDVALTVRTRGRPLHDRHVENHPAGRVEKGIGRTPPHPATVAVRVPSGTGMVSSSWALCPGHVSRIRQGASEVQADQLRDEEVPLVNYPSAPITGCTPELFRAMKRLGGRPSPGRRLSPDPLR